MTRKHLSIFVSLVALAAMSANGVSGAPAPGPVVHTASGDVAGVDQGEAQAFLGIPYAAPPVGASRWRPPAPATAWTGVRQAVAFAASCPQPAADRSGQSEDCLFLNVWKPKHVHGKAPVMVWIHGGAYVVGPGNLEDTSAFTRDGVVIVSLNYRLGRLGQFAHPALTAENPNGPLGSYTVMDQIAALRWVRRNIGAFGGDPNRVTIFGCSSGGTYVDLLMGSPAARGLFQGAISESDPFDSPWPRLQRMGGDPTGPAEAWGDRYAASIGYLNASAATLRAIPADKLLTDVSPDTTVARIAPIVDGQVVAEQGINSFRSGAIAHVPYLSSINSWEGVLARTFDPKGATVLANLGPNRPAVLALYPVAVRADPATLASNVMDDVYFRASQRIEAAATVRAGDPTWAVYFDYQAQALRDKGAPGAAHCSDNGYVFEHPARRSDKFTPSAADMAVARTLHRYYVNFARAGNPNGTGLPPWPPFGARQNILMITDNGVAPVADPDADRMRVLIPASAAMAHGAGLTPPRAAPN